MKYGLYSPGFGLFADPRVLAELAHMADDAGWDGYFLWDHVHFGGGGPDAPLAPIGDPWVTLAAMAMTTTRMKLGTIVTPLPRRHPWKLAREVTTLDYLSNGRMVLGVGIGGDAFGREYSAFGQSADPHLHGEMLDEGLEVLAGLWSGKSFSYEGKHYHVDDVAFLPTPVQPHIPVWVAGWWPNKKPFRRAAMWDGIVPNAVKGALGPAEYREMLSYIARFRESDRPLDVVRPGRIPSGDPGKVADTIAEYEAAGVTWWIVPLEDDMGSLDDLRAVIRKGPPKR